MVTKPSVFIRWWKRSSMNIKHQKLWNYYILLLSWDHIFLVRFYIQDKAQAEGQLMADSAVMPIQCCNQTIETTAWFGSFVKLLFCD
jgi:hypothetical protein